MGFGKSLRPRVFTIVLCLGLALTASTWAAPLPGSALESPIGRFLLGETAQGLDLMGQVLERKVSADDVAAFISHFRSANPESAAALEARIAPLREELYRARSARAGGKPTVENDIFSGTERSILRAVAERELAIDPDWNPRDSLTGEIRFIEPESRGLKSNRELFLGSDRPSVINVPETPGEEAPPEIQEREKNSLWDWYKESQSCLKRRPEGESKSAFWRYLAQQWVISGSVTTLGYVAHTGISRFEWGGFAVDLSTTLLNQLASVSLMGSSTGFWARWIKVYALGQVRSTVDAEIYQINPWTDTHGVPMKEAVAERRQYSYAWNTKTSWISPLMYTILSGTECLLDERTGVGAAKAASRFRAGAFVFRTGMSVGTSLMFYKKRGEEVRANDKH